jgi:hypothetical protein
VQGIVYDEIKAKILGGGITGIISIFFLHTILRRYAVKDSVTLSLNNEKCNFPYSPPEAGNTGEKLPLLKSNSFDSGNHAFGFIMEG